MDPFIVTVLLVIALVGGFCITTIGPGGIFDTIALFALLPLDPGPVAGPASATLIITGIAGSVEYFRSGRLLERHAVEAAVMLSWSSVVGVFAASQLDECLGASLLVVVVGIFVISTGVLILYRQKYTLGPERTLSMESSGRL